MENIMPDANVGIFTDDEMNKLQTTADIRLMIVKNMTDDATTTPSNVGEIRVLNEVLGGLDKSVQDSAANRLKHQSETNKEATLDMVSETLKMLSVSKRANLTSGEHELPDALKTVETVAGHLDISPEKLELEDYVAGGKS